MAQASRMMSFRKTWQCRAVLFGALLYTLGGAAAGRNIGVSHLLTGAEHALLLLGVGIAPVAAAIVISVSCGRFAEGERRASVLAAGLASLILLPLLHLVF